MLNYGDLAKGSLPLRGTPATDVLHDLAQHARRSAPVVASGHIQHVRQVGWWLETDHSGTARATSKLVPSVTDSYLLANGQQHVVQRKSVAFDSSGRVPKPFSDGATTSDETFDGPAEGPNYASSLPADATQLHDALFKNPNECGEQAQSFCIANTLLQLSTVYVLQNNVIAAFWDLMAEQDDISSLGQVSDRLGRQSEALVVPGSEAGRQLVMFADKVTGGFLGYEEILTTDDVQLGLSAPAVLAITSIAGSDLE